MPDKSISYKLLPSQSKFVNSKKKHVLYSGGFGSGKSQALCMAMLKQITIPNNQILLIRKTLSSLKKSTMINLIGSLRPVLPLGSYKFNKSEGIIKMNGGATIYCLGMDDGGMKIRSMNLGAIYIDEVTEFTQDEFNELSWRLRLDIGSRQIFCCGNPAGQNHFLYKHFFLEDNINREVVTASSIENSYLPKDYIDELKTMEGSQYKRFVEGLWITLDDVIFDTFDRNKHVKKISPKISFEEYFIGIDYGYSNPTGIIVVGKNGDRLSVIDEFYKKKCLMRDILEQSVRFSQEYPNAAIIYDPSAAGLGGELENAGLSPIKANNDVASGIDRIRNKLRIRNDSSDILISDRCTNLITEMENYQYIKGTEKPVKVNDHLIDPLRYVCSYVDDQKVEYTRPIIMTEDDITDDSDD